MTCHPPARPLIIAMIGDGCNFAEIARELNVSYGYVRNIASELYRKAGIPAYHPALLAIWIKKENER